VNTLLVQLIARTLLAASPSAAVWTSPDGSLSVTEPDPTKFSEVEAPPSPLIASWVSQDAATQLSVMQLKVPPQVQLVQSSVEEGMAEEIGSPVKRLPTVRVSGREVWKMVAAVPPVEVTQAVVRDGDTLFKVMAATTEVDRDSASISAFIDSIALSPKKSPRKEVLNATVTLPEGEAPAGIDSHNLSKMLGGAGVLFLIVALAYKTLQRKNKSGR